ncbi:aubergine, partial [Carabus blaptoides fortunei]
LKMSSSSSSSSSSSLESLEELGLIIDTIPDEKKYQEHANPFETYDEVEFKLRFRFSKQAVIYNERSNVQMMRALAEHTRLTPDERICRLKLYQNRMHNVPEVVSELNKWDMTLNSKLVELTGRILPTETIIQGKMGKVKYSAGRDSDWTPSNNKSDRYNAIKKKCCVDRGVPSQWKYQFLI